MKIKNLIFFLFLLSLASATVYFTTPTPANNTNSFTYPIVLNITTTEAGLSTPCYLEVDGVNKTGTIAGSACSYTLPYSETYFNHSYFVKGHINESSWCYQETANVSTACGGLDTGLYYNDTNITNTENFFDGNWSSHTHWTNPADCNVDGTGNCSFYINYTIPTNVASAKIESAMFSWYARSNNTIPNTCLASSILQIRVLIDYNVASYLTCYNGTDWEVLRSDFNLASGGATEEAIWWNITEVKESNETLTIPYYGCGHISASGIMLGNVLSNETCFTFDSGKALNGNGYNITGSQNGYGFDASTCGVPMLSYCNISNVNIKNFSYGLYGVSANIYNITTSSNVNDGVYFSLANCLLLGGCNAYNLTTYNNGRDGIGGAGGGISILSFNNGRYGITGLSFSDVIIYNNSNYGIYLAPPGGFGITSSCNNVTIYNQTNYIYIENDVTVTNLTIGYNASIGTIHFPSVTSALFDSGYLSSTTSLLQPNFVSLNTAGVNAKFSVPANITINTSSCTDTIFKRTGFPTTYADILLGSAYTPTYSSCAGNIWTFDVTGFSGYAIGENPITFNSSTASPTNGSSSTGISTNINFTIEVSTTGTNPICSYNINGNTYVGTYSSGVCSYYGSITPGIYYWNVTVTVSEGGSATSDTFSYILNDPGGGGGGGAPSGGESGSSETEVSGILDTGDSSASDQPSGDVITAVYLGLFSAPGVAPTYMDTTTETLITPTIILLTDGLIQPLIGSCPIDRSNIFSYLFGIIYCEEVTLYSLFLGKYIWLGWIFFIAMIVLIISIIAVKRKDILDLSLLGGLISNFIFGIFILLVNSIIITYILRGMGIEAYM